MGRIKSLTVKKIAKQLVKEEKAFTGSFEHNKMLLKGQFPSKPIKNKIAGYIARLVKMQKAQKID